MKADVNICSKSASQKKTGKEYITMKRTIALLLALILGIGVFSACTAGTDTPAGPENSATSESGASTQSDALPATSEEKVTISYLSRWVNPSDPQSGYYMERLEEFRKQNPNIIVEDVSMGDDNEAHRVKIYSGVASNDLPDLFVCSLAFPLREWAKNSVISSITPLVTSEDWTGPSGSMLEMFTFEDGQVYGVPKQLTTAGVFVNTKLLADLGLEIPQTWEDIEAMVEPLKAAGVVPFGLAAQSVNEIDRFFNLLSTRMYGFEFRDKLLSKEIKWTDDMPKSILSKFKELIDKGIIDPDAVSLAPQNGILPMFEQGQVAMVLAASWNFALIEAMPISKDVKCISFPYFSDKPEYKDIWLGAKNEGFVLTSEPGTPEYEAAGKLLAFMMGAESFQGAAETLGGGSYPVDVDFSKVNMGPVMSSFTEAFATNSALIDDYTAYIADSKIPLLQPTNTEIQALFVGRSVDDVAQAIDAIYMENR